MKKLVFLMLMAVMLTTIFSACRSAEPQPATDGAGTVTDVATPSEDTEPQKDTLIVIGEAEVKNFNPLTQRGRMDRFVKSALFDHLVRFGDNAELTPCLAESWTILDDNLTIEFKLRQGVKFHDGSDFTADDVICSFDVAMSDESMVTTYAASITGYTKIDDYTVQVTRPAAYADPVGFLANYFPIISQDAYEADPEGFSSNPVGSGAYRFVSQEMDSSVVMAANEDYFFGAPEIKNLIIKAPLDSATSALALETGEVDLIFNVPSALLPTLQANDSIVTITEQTYSSVVLNIYKGSGADQNLRKAIFHGINRENAILIATDGLSAESKNILSTKAMGKYDGAVEYIGYDEALAKEYLAKSSYVAGTPLVISCIPLYAPTAQSIQSDLAKIGVTIEIEQLDINTYREMTVKGELKIGLSNYGAFGFGPITMLQYLLPTNVSFGKNMDSSPEFEAVMAQLLATNDPDEIDSLVREGLKLRDDLATLFSLYDITSTLAYSNKITNISNTAAIVNGACYFGDIKLAD